MQDFVPWMESTPPAVEAQSPDHWTTREVPHSIEIYSLHYILSPPSALYSLLAPSRVLGLCDGPEILNVKSQPGLSTEA